MLASSRMQEADSMMQAAAAAAGAGGALVGNEWRRTIVDHPLYPLLQIVFQKCELATSSPRDAQTETMFSSESFTADIRKFVDACRQQRISITTNQTDVDQFMLSAIEVLRFHLMELEKVHQLCDNFCSRYITTLKGKMPVDYVVEDNNNNSGVSGAGGGNGGGTGGNGTGGGNANNASNQNSSASNQNSSATPANSTGSSTSSSNGTNGAGSSNGHELGASAGGGGGGASLGSLANSNNAPSSDYPTTTSAGSSGAYYFDMHAASGHHAAHAHSQQPHSASLTHLMSAGGYSSQHSLDNATGLIKHERPHDEHNGANSNQQNQTSISNSQQQPTASNQQPDSRTHDDVRSPTGSTGKFLN